LFPYRAMQNRKFRVCMAKCQASASLTHVEARVSRQRNLSGHPFIVWGLSAR
jgi:hypothetical protein